MEAGPGPRRHLEMGDTGGPSETSGGHGSGNDLPVMPGPEKPLLHTAIEFVETLDNTLAEHQMLNIAHGELPADAACIIDVPIEAVALPDPSHPQSRADLQYAQLALGSRLRGGPCRSAPW